MQLSAQSNRRVITTLIKISIIKLPQLDNSQQHSLADLETKTEKMGSMRQMCALARLCQYYPIDQIKIVSARMHHEREPQQQRQQPTLYENEQFLLTRTIGLAAVVLNGIALN